MQQIEHVIDQPVAPAALEIVLQAGEVGNAVRRRLRRSRRRSARVVGEFVRARSAIVVNLSVQSRPLRVSSVDLAAVEAAPACGSRRT